MQWFKHDTDAATDAKIRKLIMRYGTDGYAIYFHCIELIVGNVSEHNITFELEHDAEIIADNLKIQGTSDTSPVDRVNQIMKYIVSLGLFEESKGRIFCYKILKRLDSSMTSSTKMRGIITRAKQSHDKVMISHDSVMQEENRIEEKRIEQKRTEEKREETPDKPAKSQKHKHGEYKHVLLTSDEYQRLCEDWGEQEVLRMIKTLDEGIETKGYKYKNHNLALRKWKANDQKGGYSKPLPVQTRTTFLDMED
jgi:hypothetical protein